MRRMLVPVCVVFLLCGCASSKPAVRTPPANRVIKAKAGTVKGRAEIAVTGQKAAKAIDVPSLLLLRTVRGKPAGKTTLNFYGQGGSYHVVTGKNGTYSIDLPEGLYTVTTTYGLANIKDPNPYVSKKLIKNTIMVKRGKVTKADVEVNGQVAMPTKSK